MILGIDIGNSNIVFGVYHTEDSPPFCTRAKTDPLKTEWEYAVLINEMLLLGGFETSALVGAALSSVVPSLTPILAEAVRLVCGVVPLVVGPGVKTGLNIRIDDPSTTGADLVCTAVGAIEKYSLPAIVIDLGTATKILAIDHNRNFLGGAVAPGVLVSLGALSKAAAQLPTIGLHSDIKIIGTNTVDCMMSGSILGTACMLDGMVARYRAALGGKATAVACGGLVDAIVPHCTADILVDRDLLLNGLMAIYRKNKG